MSFLTGTNMELLYANDSPGTAKNTFTSEVQINDQTGMGPQCFLPHGFFNYPGSSRRSLKIIARGLVSSTGTPTFTFTVRSGTAGNTSAAILLGTGALTTTSGAASRLWEFEGDVVFGDMAGSGAATSGRGGGIFSSPLGFAGSGLGETWGGGAQPGTFSTFDPTIDNYLNFNVACSASSVSNAVQLLQFLAYGQN